MFFLSILSNANADDNETAIGRHFDRKWKRKQSDRTRREKRKCILLATMTTTKTRCELKDKEKKKNNASVIYNFVAPHRHHSSPSLDFDFNSSLSHFEWCGFGRLFDRFCQRRSRFCRHRIHFNSEIEQFRLRRRCRNISSNVFLFFLKQRKCADSQTFCPLKIVWLLEEHSACVCFVVGTGDTLDSSKAARQTKLTIMTRQQIC